MPWLLAPRVLDETTRQRSRLRHQRVERGDNRLAARMDKFQHAIAPFAGIEAELVLQAHHIAGTVVGHFGRQAIRILAAVVDEMDHARIS